MAAFRTLRCRTSDGFSFTLTGKIALALRMLIKHGDGITPLDCIPWTVRLGSMIFQLRHRYGLVIVTEMEPHEGGLHARYFLRTSVAIES